MAARRLACGDARTKTARPDRLARHCRIVETGTESRRVKTRARPASPDPQEPTRSRSPDGPSARGSGAIGAARKRAPKGGPFDADRGAFQCRLEDAAKRSQLGAHTTEREKMMQIVGPVVVEQPLAEWESVKAGIAAAPERAAQAKTKAARIRAENAAAALKEGFLEWLAGLRLLDPACGSGSSLYLALLALKDIEHRVNLEAEAMDLPRGFPRIGPECVPGIVLNPHAAETACVSVRVGEIR